MSDKRTVLVTGATGKQGGAAVDALLARGHDVVAMTRNPGSERARSLAGRGVAIVAGDFSDPDSVVRAATGTDTLYAMTTPFEAGIEAEIAQGLTLANAAKSAGVGHLILGSVASADRNTGIPHFDSKFQVETHLASLGIPYSIVAPVYFMDNLLEPWMLPSLREGNLAIAMPADRPLQQVAVSNIGDFAAAVAERRDAVFGKRFDIAGDELTGTRTATVLSDASGREFQFQGFPPDALREQSEDLAVMFEWFYRVGYSADIQALRRDFSDVPWLSFEEWARAQDWSGLN